jgi:predicted protein tyrosine phosphatase
MEIIMKTITTLFAAAAIAIATSTQAEEMLTITIGDKPAPVDVVMIIYSDRDPDATIADFVKTNPQHASILVTGFLKPGATFLVPN